MNKKAGQDGESLFFIDKPFLFVIGTARFHDRAGVTQW
jgi:hypothetical protein